jgi:hypothetical protein
MADATADCSDGAVSCTSPLRAAQAGLIPFGASLYQFPSMHFTYVMCSAFLNTLSLTNAAAETFSVNPAARGSAVPCQYVDTTTKPSN